MAALDEAAVDPETCPPPEAFVEDLISRFKTRPCSGLHEPHACPEFRGERPCRGLHDHRSCPFFHGERDRRREVLYPGGRLYAAEPCGEKFDSLNTCPRGDACGLCHSTAELLYHPDVFRKRLCHQGEQCPRGRFCAFAHSRRELLVPYFSEADEQNLSEEFIAHHFKTQWCLVGGPHDWENCVYAHTYRDWRRVPAIGYSSRPCFNWAQSISSGNSELSYNERCKRGMACPLAHGCKEQLYHPQFYKTNPCIEKRCKRGVLCAFNHGPQDARQGKDTSAQRYAREKYQLPNAEELLALYQPTAHQPPNYHALEESAVQRLGVAGSGRGRGTCRANQNGAGEALAVALAAGPPLPSGTPSWPWLPEGAWCEQGKEAGAGNDCSSQGPALQHFIPPGYYCQWLPCAEPAAHFVPPMPDCGGEAWSAAWGPAGQGPPGQSYGFTPMLWDVAAMPCRLLPAGLGPWQPEALTGLAEDTSDSAQEATETSASAISAAAGLPHMEVENLPSVLALDGVLQNTERFSGHAAVIGHGSKREVRTPSWSPPQSATPTEVPSPRPADFNAGSSGCSWDASQDEVAPLPGAPAKVLPMQSQWHPWQLPPQKVKVAARGAA